MDWVDDVNMVLALTLRSFEHPYPSQSALGKSDALRMTVSWQRGLEGSPSRWHCGWT